MGILISIVRAGALITSFLVPSIEAAFRIRSLFDLDPSFTVNLYNLTGAALSADDQVLAIVNQWRASKSLPALPAEIQPLTPGTAVAMPIMLIPQNLAAPPSAQPAAPPCDPPPAA